MLFKILQAKRDEVVSSWEKKVKKYYFNMILFSSTFAKRGQAFIKVLEDSAAEKEKMDMKREEKKTQVVIEICFSGGERPF